MASAGSARRESNRELRRGGATGEAELEPLMQRAYEPLYKAKRNRPSYQRLEACLLWSRSKPADHQALR